MSCSLPLSTALLFGCKDGHAFGIFIKIETESKAFEYFRGFLEDSELSLISLRLPCTATKVGVGYRGSVSKLTLVLLVGSLLATWVVADHEPQIRSVLAML